MPSKRDQFNKHLQDLYTAYHDNRFYHMDSYWKYHLVGSFRYRLSDEEEQLYTDRISGIKGYFNKLISNLFRGRIYPKIFMIEHKDWTYLEYKEKSGESRRYRDLIKLCIPVAYEKLARVSIPIVEFLVWRGKRFSFRVAHYGRKDTMNLWIKREELDDVVEFLQVFIPEVEEPAFFYPEYRSIAITREVRKTTYHDILAHALEWYIRAKAQEDDCSLRGLAEMVSQWDPWDEFGNIDFGHSIVLKSLRCIEYVMCPVETSPYNIVDFLRKEF